MFNARLSGLSGKKAQDATNAAVLVGLITALIILYILFLPPADRDALLNDDSSGQSRIISTSKSGRINATLIHENPGRIDFFADKEFTHTIPSFFLLKSTNANVLKSEQLFTVRNGVFDKKDFTTKFSIKDLEHTENVMLSFTAIKRTGSLIINLNGKEIFNAPLSDANLAPIQLEKSALDTDNVLEFKVSPVGWQFWKTNEYIIQNMKVTSDITDVSKQESANVFSISSIEKFNLEKAKLKFIPDCRGEIGKLTAWLNSVELLSAVPDCDTFNIVEIPVSAVEAGENRLVFRTEQGSYMIDRITVETKLKDVPTIVYFFDVTPGQKAAIDRGNLTANLSIIFVDDDKQKNAGIFINGHATALSQTTPMFSKIIPPYHLQAGKNDLRIDPKSTLLIVTLKLDLIEK